MPLCVLLLLILVDILFAFYVVTHMYSYFIVNKKKCKSRRIEEPKKKKKKKNMNSFIRCESSSIRLMVIRIYLYCVKRMFRPIFVYVPVSTCTRTLATSAFDGEHEYRPESAKSAFCIRRWEMVTSAFSVITDTPPRAESKLITSS